MDHRTTPTITDALASWNRVAVEQQVRENELLRTQFVEQFPPERWFDLPLERYALGQTVEGGTLCWWLEFKTRIVGSMSGGTASKHLIYFHKSDHTWRFPLSYGSVENAWIAVRQGFVDALRLAAESRFDEIDGIQSLAGANALRSKVIYMYFPNELLPISSKEHLDHFLQVLGAPANDWGAIHTNRQLLERLRAEPELARLSAQELGIFVYHWADPRFADTIVKIAPGEQGRYWEDCLDGNYICVGWDDVGDLNEFASKEEFLESFREHYPYGGNNAQVSRKANEVWTLRQLSPGDKVIANKGISEVLAVGTVNEAGYEWRPERPELRHTVGVDWDTSFAQQIPPVRAWATTTVARVPVPLYKAIVEGGTEPIPTAHVVDDILRSIEEAVNRKGQVILYGPPGTGKTYLARRAALWLAEGGSTNPSAGATLDDEMQFLARERALGGLGVQRHNVWFMVVNPSHWRWASIFTDRGVTFSRGRIQRNYPRVRAGDLVVGYESTPTLRIVALAQMIAEYDPDGPADEALTLKPLAELSDGLTWAELLEDPILAGSEPLRFRCQGTLFALTSTEAAHLLTLLATKNPSVMAAIGPAYRQLTRVTFHPSYTYDDFIEGFRPQTSQAGTLELVLTDGLFKQICISASSSPDIPFVLLIDEINRGNIPKVFGELITLIEVDKRGLTLRLPQSGDEFAVPRNLVIIGTMNTADRSIHLLDAALRRRFAFIELLPDSELLRGATAGQLALDLFLDNLNQEIRQRVGREKQVGHAVFYNDGAMVDTAEGFAAVFRFELLPLLQEYFYEDYSALADLLGTEVIDRDAEEPRSLEPEALCSALAARFSANVGQ